MTGEFDSDFEQFDRPFQEEPAPELTELRELPDWKQPDFGEDMANWDEENPFPTTGFTTPTYLD